jgi:Holliday junction resolvase RusA-like endonuclease
MIHLLLAGPIVPYTRMTQGSLWTERSKRYLASQYRLRVQMQVVMAASGLQMYQKGIPLRVRIHFGWCLHNRDIDNEAKAVLDAAKGILFADDRWVDEIVATREGSGDRLELYVEAI